MGFDVPRGGAASKGNAAAGSPPLPGGHARSKSAMSSAGANIAPRARGGDPALVWDEPPPMPPDYGTKHVVVTPPLADPGTPAVAVEESPRDVAWFESQHLSGFPTVSTRPSAAADGRTALAAVGRSPGAVPRVIQDVRRGLSQVSCGHLHRIIAQLMAVEQITDIPTWLPIVQRLAVECALQLSPAAIARPGQKHKSFDPREFVKVKKLADDAAPTASAVEQGVVFSKNLTHRAMPRAKARPRVLLLSGALEYQKKEHLLTLDTIIPKEPEYMRDSVKKALRFKPDVILVEKTVSRTAQVRARAAGRRACVLRCATGMAALRAWRGRHCTAWCRPASRAACRRCCWSAACRWRST